MEENEIELMAQEIVTVILTAKGQPTTEINEKKELVYTEEAQSRIEFYTHLLQKKYAK